VSLLHSWIAAGQFGPLIVLSGVADVTTAATLTAVISEQLSGAARHLMIDVSRLRFADSSSIWLLVIAARTLIGDGGSMTLIRPQPAVAKMLALIDADQVITILGETLPGPEGRAEIPDLSRPPHAPTLASHRPAQADPAIAVTGHAQVAQVHIPSVVGVGDEVERRLHRVAQSCEVQAARPVGQVVDE
jgi:anti-anti-sigma factor